MYCSLVEKTNCDYVGEVIGCNLEFITDANAGVSWRWGRIRSPWWAYNPYQSKIHTTIYAGFCQ